MSRIKRDALILVVVAILLAAAAYFAFPLSKTNLGLDLQGGLSVILEAQDTAKNPRTDDGMTQAVKIIQNRVNGLGVAEPEIQRQGEWKISVQLPGIDNPEEAMAVIGKTAVLEFYHVEEQFGTPYATEEEALAAAGVESAQDLPADKTIVRWGPEGGNQARPVVPDRHAASAHRRHAGGSTDGLRPVQPAQGRHAVQRRRGSGLR